MLLAAVSVAWLLCLRVVVVVGGRGARNVGPPPWPVSSECPLHSRVLGNDVALRDVTSQLVTSPVRHTYSPHPQLASSAAESGLPAASSCVVCSAKTRHIMWLIYAAKFRLRLLTNIAAAAQLSAWVRGTRLPRNFSS